MSQVLRMEVRNLDTNVREQRYARAARQHLRIPVYGTETVQLFWAKAATGLAVPSAEAQSWAERVFCDPVLQEYTTVHRPEFRTSAASATPSFVVQVRFLPGVTDNVGRTATEALRLLSPFARENEVTVFTGKAVYFYGDLSRAEVEKVAGEILGNPLIEELRVLTWVEYNAPSRFEAQTVPEVVLKGEPKLEIISLDAEDRTLERMSRDRCWALTIAELKTIKGYFARSEVKLAREKAGMSHDPTDVEMEILAQTWSEHCKHKIFGAEIDYTEVAVEGYPALGSFTVRSLFKSYIRKVTEELNPPWLVSVFTDNAGVVRFDPNIDLCIKVETHNSPSALDPYGGALTGIVGVNRDVLGCGLGARPIANTDVFCFGPPDWPGVGEEKELPEGLKHPRRIFEGVHLGV
jgi:phosphoribosylformylglycinamidine (FGAM) synthase PurS component